MTIAERMRKKLQDGFTPDALEVVDESDQHRGHGGWRDGGETHFRVRMVAAAFEGRSRIERQRAVHKALEAEIAERVHALALELRAPSEI
jgi:BolA protein